MLADAVLRIAAREGILGISLSEVASEAQVSKGMLQHYFPSKQHLLLAATGRLRERTDQRVRSAIAAADSADHLRAVLLALLPSTAEARIDAAAGHAFFVLALTDPTMNERYRTGRRLAITAIAQLASQSTSAPMRQAAARALLRLVSDLGDDLLLGEITPADAEAAIDSALAELGERA